MVDAVVSIALNRLADFLIDEAVFLGSVRQEVEWLKNELGWMQCYIASAEEKQDDNPIARKWLNDITNIAYDAEDVLDKFIIQVHDEETKEKGQSAGCFPSTSSCVKCRKKVNLPEELVNLHDIGKDIEELKIRINDLSRIRELYKFESSSNKGEGNSSNYLARLRQLRRTTSFSVEKNVVGHDDGTKRLMAKLLNQDRRRFVVSIYGMGGLGKTTLAGKLYHHLDVKMKFDCRAWVCVSQDYNTRDLLLRIISSFGITTEADEADEAEFKNHKELASKGKKKPKELKQMNEEELERYLYKALKGRSYLLVADDIWKIEAWESFKRAFPDCNNGSRVIITTRSQEVAEDSDERTYAHKLRFLTIDESWSLFCEKAFGNPDANGVDEQLKTLGKDMVQKCGGLPLAVIVLGGLLSNKTQLAEWKAVRDHIWQKLKKDPTHIPNLFDLSFNDLNYQSKLCFLYLSLFPEDFEIDVDQLMRLWVAEGFVPQDENRNMEDMAKDNFHELINRSLIQIGKISWGRVATCRVHDLLRELAIEKARELNLLYIYDQMKHSTGNSSVISSCRREALYSPKNCLWLHQSNPSLRSLLSFDPYGYKWDIMTKITDMCTKFRFLRVLKLDGYPLDERALSKEIGKLIHLKYLGLRESKVKYLPRSILNLRRLQTLDLFSLHDAVQLPNEISKLQELRHLFGLFNGNLEIDSLRKLQSLKYVFSKIWNSINTEKLDNLRELWIYGSVERTKKEFRFDSIAKLERLEQLAVVVVNDDCFTSLQPLTRCSNLTVLRLNGKIEKLPEDIHNVLPNLECLLLKNSCLKDDPMPLLEKLGCLMILNLGLRFYSGRKLFCSAQGFRQLEILKLDIKDEIGELQVEEEAMPRLRGFTIPNNSCLRIPERFRSIPPPADWDFKVEYWFDSV